METKELFVIILNELIETKKDEDYTLSLPKQAESIGISYQTFKKYVDGTSEPPISNLLKIAKYYNVSTDYLLGNSNCKSTKQNIIESVKTTGLNENSINILNNEINGCYGKCDLFDPKLYLHFIDKFIAITNMHRNLFIAYEFLINEEREFKHPKTSFMLFKELRDYSLLHNRINRIIQEFLWENAMGKAFEEFENEMLSDLVDEGEEDND